MNLLLTLALSAVLVTPVRPATVEPDSGSVAFTTATLELLRARAATDSVDPEWGYINSKGEWIPSPAQTIDGEASDGAADSDFLPLDPEVALAVLMGEHRLSLPIFLQADAWGATTPTLAPR